MYGLFYMLRPPRYHIRMSHKDVVINKVEQYRMRHGMTQEALAEAVGVTRQTIIALEKGNYAPSVMLALKIARHFKVPVDSIFSLSC